MNRISNWYSPKEVLPLPDKLILIKYGDYDYFLGRFDMLEETKNGHSVGFLGESDYSCMLEDMIAWAYIELDDTNSL